MSVPTFRHVANFGDPQWQFLEGPTVSRTFELPITAAIHHDPTLAQVANLPAGWAAERSHIGGPWRVYSFVANG